MSAKGFEGDAMGEIRVTALVRDMSEPERA